jgi:hypothetical protein
MGEYVSPVSPEEGGSTPQELNAELTTVLDWLPKENSRDAADAVEAAGIEVVKYPNHYTLK